MKFPYPLKFQPPLGVQLEDRTLLIYRNESSWTGFDKDEISLYQNVKGEFFLKGRPIREPRSWYGGKKTNPIKEIRVSKRWVCSLYERLEHASIPASEHRSGAPAAVSFDGGPAVQWLDIVRIGLETSDQRLNDLDIE